MKFLFSVLLLLMFQNSFAGRETGNGGFAHVCRNSSGKIVSAKLLDLWESEKLKTWSSSEPSEKQIEKVLEKIGNISLNAYMGIKENLTFIQKKENQVFSSRPLSKTKDAFPPYDPGEGCAYEQVARFENVLTETGKRGLRIYSEIYDSPFFTESDRAALMVHEAIYLQDRIFNGAKTSTRTRMLVAHVFSDSKVPNSARMTFATLVPKDEDGKSIHAVTNPASFYYTLHISSLDGVTYSEDIRPEQKNKLYRCMGRSLSTRDLADTGWTTIDKILSLDNPNVGTPGVPYFSVTGRYSAHVYPPRQIEESQSYFFSEAIMFSCRSKDESGKEFSVPFEGYYLFEDGSECLGMDKDGSISVESGDSCLEWVKATKADKRGEFRDLVSFEVVRSLK